MTAYNGTSVLSPHRAEDTLRCSATIIPGLDIHTITFPPEEIASVVPISQSDWAYVQQDENKTAYGGTKTDSFLDDYYYRIHITPASIAFGNVTNPVEEEFIIWNAWFVSKIMASITEDYPDEYVLDPSTTPMNFEPLESTTFTVTVDDDGSPEFEATLTFNFPLEEPVLTISATRVAVFPFEPLIPMTESLEWLTDIIRAKDGSEQRISIRPTPRQAFSMDVLMTTEQKQARLDALMFNLFKRAWGVSHWGEWEEHNDTILADDTVIYLDTTNADFRDDSYAVIWQSDTVYESVKILTVESDRLNLEKPVIGNYSGKKWIMPMRIGYMTSPVNWKVDADGVGRFKCGFIVKDNLLLTTYTPELEYEGLPVLPPSLEDGGLDNTIESDVTMVDYGLDNFTQFSDSDFNIYVQSHVFRKEGKDEIWKFREFLHYLYGRRNAVWICSDKEDFVQTVTLGAAGTELTVANAGWARRMGLNTLRTHIAFIHNNGTIYCREITGITSSGDEEIIGIDTALGVQIEPGDCTICLLDKCRLTEDKIEMEWEEPFVLKCKANFTRVVE